MIKSTIPKREQQPRVIIPAFGIRPPLAFPVDPGPSALKTRPVIDGLFLGEKKKKKRGKVGRRERNGNASHELGTSPAAPPQANKRAERAAGSGTIPAPSVSCIPPAGIRTAGNPHGRSCLPKFRIWALLPSRCLSAGSERGAGRGVAEVKGLSWKSGKNPQKSHHWGLKGGDPCTCSR